MKSELLQDAVGMLDDDILVGGEKIERKKTKWIVAGVAGLAIVAAAACVVLIGLAGNAKKTWPIKHISVQADDNNEISMPITENTWKETGNAGRYLTVNFANTDYSTCTWALSEDLKGVLLGSGTAVGQDYFSMEIHRMDVNIYSIKGVDTGCAVAVQFTEPDESVTGMNYVYAYMNTDYTPDTLGEMINMLNFNDCLKTDFAYMDASDSEDTIVFENLPKEKVMELLEANSAVKNEPDAQTGRKAMSIGTRYLETNNSITLTEDGYLCTNILAMGKYFYIGKDKVEEFVDYVKNNCDGFIYVYDVMDEVQE